MQRGVGGALRSVEPFSEPPSPFMHYLHHRHHHTIYSFNHPSIHLFIYSLMPFRTPPPSFGFSIPSKVRPVIINRSQIFIRFRFMYFFIVSISFFFFFVNFFLCWFFLACSHSSVFFPSLENGPSFYVSLFTSHSSFPLKRIPLRFNLF